MIKMNWDPDNDVHIVCGQICEAGKVDVGFRWIS